MFSLELWWCYMSYSIADQLRKRLKEKNLSIREAERQADLKMNAVRNIIRGVVKQPTAHTLKMVANVLNCSVDDLLQTDDPTDFSPVHKKDTGLSLPLKDYDLLERSVHTVIHMAKKRECELSIGQALNLIRSIYSYSSKKPQKTIEMDFVEWLFEGALNSEKD